MKETTKILLRASAKRVGLFLVRHRFAVLVVAIVLYFLFWPKSTPLLSGDRSTHSRSSEAVEVPLYDPAADGADPKLSLPVELTREELQALAKVVDKLAVDTATTMGLEQEHSDLVFGLLEPQVKNLLWPALRGNGFKDQKLPLDWYALVKDNYDTAGQMTAVAELSARAMTYAGIQERLESAKVHILGGKVLTGDTLFVKGVQGSIERRLAYLSKSVSQMVGVFYRLRKEFPWAFGRRSGASG